MADGWLSLYSHQRKALEKMKNGCILGGEVGSGKSRTALAYYYILNGGNIDSPKYTPMTNPCDLTIITTARKRDTLDWEKEMIPFFIAKDTNILGLYNHKVTVDSWNNIHKYSNFKDGFFIFDEQRVKGDGPWVDSFLEITKNNQWILLSATPGDSWKDYIPVFLANGFYRNKTGFYKEHVLWNPYVKYRTVDRYLNEKKLRILRREILVEMPMKKTAVKHENEMKCDYDEGQYRDILKRRWNFYENKPIENASEVCSCLRRCVNTNKDRLNAVKLIQSCRHKVIIFYNFNYELELLKNIKYEKGTVIAEWNGHKHEDIPKYASSWVYLVQYTAGAEGWNCTDTDTIIFYSQSYSYSAMIQAAGRIDRINTPFSHLYYYKLFSNAPIDLAIRKCLKSKKDFNEKKFLK